jgi:hypothetical protein
LVLLESASNTESLTTAPVAFGTEMRGTDVGLIGAPPLLPLPALLLPLLPAKVKKV